jgi:hypothetical protein
MRYICTVSAAARLGFWMFVFGAAFGLFLGLQV